MRSILSAVLCTGVAFATTTAQTNIEFVGHLSYAELHNSELANLWGYTDELGNEYALVGVNGTDPGTGGLSVVDLSDPADPQEIFFLAGPASRWREIKVWNDHVYITTEAENGGLTIVDLSPLPESTALPSAVYQDPNWDNSHALFIDENGRLYIFGAGTGNGGAIMYDLTQDPMAPVEVGRFDPSYIHDGFARGDTLYAGHILNGYFTIVDVSDPAAPVQLGLQTTPNAFTHNVWLDASGDHLYTTDERTNAYVGSYDISDPVDIQFLDKLQSDPGSGAIPHNTYWLPSGHLVQSYYTYGVSIYDASRPDNLVEVGHYDTSPISGGGFFGAWGVYPFFSSGRLIISDIEEGLFVLDPTYVRACWLEGAITNSVSGAPVAQARLSIEGTNALDVTEVDGLYGTGHVQAGTYVVTVTAPGYYPATIEGVVLANGVVTVQNVQLDPLPIYHLSGTVRSAGSLDLVEGAQLWVVNDTYTFTTTTDADGTFYLPVIYDGSYEFTIGRWGWHTACPADLVIDGADITDRVIELEQGYADDFALDLGWQVSSTASRGAWVRSIPVGTSLDDVPANPAADVSNDCRGYAFVTGNGGGTAGADDVDEGGTLLTSPLFDATGMEDPHVRYHHWFFDGEGNSVAPAGDAFVISLTDGADTVAIETITATSGAMSSWVFSNVRIADHIAPTTTMRLLAYTADMAPNNDYLEAALDDFSIVPMSTTGIVGPGVLTRMLLWPNPTTSQCTIQLPTGMEANIEVLDAVGRVVRTGLRTSAGRLFLVMDLPNGSYVIRARTTKGALFVEKLVVG